MLKLETRTSTSPVWLYAAPLLAVLLTLVSGAMLFAALGFDPGEALYGFFIKPISTRYGLSELFVKATPLTLIAIGLALGFRANVWNIGAEGQLTMGAIAAGGMALAFYGDEGPWLLPLMLLAGFAGGMAYAAIPAFLRTRFNANEILTSLMLTYVATLFLSYLVHGPWRDPDGYNFPESRLFNDAALLPLLFDGSRMHLGALLALLVVLAAWLLIARGFIGFQIKVIGLSASAAGYAGFKQRRIIWFTLLTCGGLAGLAGMMEVSGPIGQLLPTVSPGCIRSGCCWPRC